MNIDFDYRPLPIHVPFHQSGEYERALFGAFGSGKSYGICSEAIAWALEQPGIRGLVTRKTVPELRDTTEAVFIDILPHALYKQCTIKRSGGHIERVIFPNGSEVLFRSLDDWNKHRSLNVGFIAYDEANEIDEETYLGMASRVRQRDPTAAAKARGASEISRRGIWLATNPNGHDWLYERFVGSKAHPRTTYFKSTSFDNPFLPQEYLESLMGYPLPWIKRYVLCAFDDFAGQIYTDWNYDDHVVALPSKFPHGSVWWMAMDPGTRNPTAGLWAYVEKEKRRLVLTDEYLGNAAAVEHAKEWRRIEAARKANVEWRVSDPGSINTRDRGSNMKLSDQYRRLGFNFNLGPKNHDERIPMLQQLITMKRIVCTENTMQAFEQIKNYRWEDITPAARAKGADPRETPLKKDDHLVDCAQYLSSRWVRPIRMGVPIEQETFSTKAQKLIRQKLGAPRNPVPNNDLSMVL
jgi:PBSX family phage terminase large subunit